MNFVRVSTVLILIGITWLNRVSLKTWVTPVTAYSAPFALTLLGQELGLRDAPFEPRAATLVLGASLLISIGSLLVATLQNPWGSASRMILPAISVRLTRWGPLVLGGGALGIVVLVLYLRPALSSTGLGDIEPGLFDRVELLEGIRGTSIGVAYRAFTTLSYVAAIAYSLAWISRARLRALYASALLVGTLAIAIQAATKMGFIVQLLIILAVFVIAIPLRPGRQHARTYVAAVAACVAALLALLTVQVSARRHGAETEEDAKRMLVSIVGGPAGLSAIHDHGHYVRIPGGRGLTLAGLLDLSAVRRRSLGIYDRTVELVPGDRATRSNIYTGLHMVLVDYAWPGFVATFLGLGLLGGFLQRRYAVQASTPRLVRLVAYYLLLIAMPQVMLTYYNFWWLIFLSAPGFGLLFSIASEANTPVPTGVAWDGARSRAATSGP